MELTSARVQCRPAHRASVRPGYASRQRRVSLCSSSVETGLCIRTIDKGKIGSSSTNDPQQWQACLDAAIAGGRLATPMVWKGLPDPVALPDALGGSLLRLLRVGHLSVRPFL